MNMKKYSILLSAALMMGMVSGCGSAAGGEEVSTIITMDVNPSIQMQLNRDDAVVSVIGENKEAEEILKDMDLEQTDMTVAVNAVIGSMVKQGYLTTENNTVLLSVENDDADERFRVEKELSENISSTLSTYDISGAILAQDMDIDDDMETIVSKYDISYGKAALIEEIMEERSDYKIEDLVKLNAQDLILIYESVDDDRDVSKMTGTVSTSKYITRDEALNIALSNAKKAKNEVSGLEVEFGYEDGRLTYEIEFNADGFEYEYEIDAQTKKVVRSVDRDDDDDDDRKNTQSSSGSSSSSSSNSGSSSSQGTTNRQPSSSNNNNRYDDDRYDDDRYDDDRYDDDRYDDDDDDRYDDDRYDDDDDDRYDDDRYDDDDDDRYDDDRDDDNDDDDDDRDDDDDDRDDDD